MAVRPSMADIILQLRGLTDATLGETTVNGIDYWDDEQLQAILDYYRVDALDVPLLPASQLINGSVVYLRYYFPDDMMSTLETDFILRDSNGTQVVSWSYAPGTRYVLFAANQLANTITLTGNSYNLRKAAARVWLTKASQRSQLIDWKAGGQTMSEDQEYQHCMLKFQEFAGAEGIGGLIPGIPSGSRSVRLKREGYTPRAEDLIKATPSGLEIISGTSAI